MVTLPFRIEHLLACLTTTGEVERWHQSIQRDLLDDALRSRRSPRRRRRSRRWWVEYNSAPHQSLGMAAPGDRFPPAPPRPGLPLWVPQGLITSPAPTPEGAAEPETAVEPAVTVAGVVEVEWAVPPGGNFSISRQQFWFGPHRAGEVITFLLIPPSGTKSHKSTLNQLMSRSEVKLRGLHEKLLPRVGTPKHLDLFAYADNGLSQSLRRNIAELWSLPHPVSLLHRRAPGDVDKDILASRNFPRQSRDA